jgi:hypothetical protein
LRENLCARGALARLGIDQHHFHARFGSLPAQRRGELEVHGKQHSVQHDRSPDSHREHAIVAGRNPTQIHVRSYFSGTSLS